MGDDSLQGSRGKGHTTDGLGQDDIFGGKGNDIIHARDGARDEIRCDGGNNAVAIVDNKDVIVNEQDCETFRRGR